MYLTFVEEEGVEILTDDIQRKTVVGIYLLRQNNRNTIYSRKVALCMWTWFVWLRMFLSDGIYNNQFAEDVAKLFHSVNSYVLCW